MKKTEDMIKDKQIWAGLNKPDLTAKDADIVIFGIPFDGGVSFRNGAKDAPSSLREITYTIPPTTEHFESLADLKIVDLGDISGKTREEIFRKTEDVVLQLVKDEKFFIMIGGDHSTTIPVQRGIDKALEESFGIIHIDAHFDLCDRLEGDELSHGSTERRALELNNITDTESIFFLGIRSVEMDELEFMSKNKINVVNSHGIHKMGIKNTLEIVREKMKRFNKIYITLDIDCLDPAYAAGTGTPQFGGLNSRQLLDLLHGLFELPIMGMDIVEVAPVLDPSLTSVFAARKIITECWGHYRRKKNNGY